jgi:hypothetical protein
MILFYLNKKNNSNINQRQSKITVAGIPLNYNGNPNFTNYAFVDPEAILNEKYPEPPEPVIADVASKIGQPASTEPPGVVQSFFIGMWSGVHNALDIAGFIPVVGEVPDGINALIYLAEGDKINAGLSAAAMIPVVGVGATAGKAAKKIAGAVGDATGQVTKRADDLVDAGKISAKQTDRVAITAIEESIKGRLKAAQLPTSGKIRYVPREDYNPVNPLPRPLPRGKHNGYIDRFGNEWVKGPSRTPGQAFEWDVQLPKNGGDSRFRSLSPDGKHVNVTLDGRISH